MDTPAPPEVWIIFNPSGGIAYWSRDQQHAQEVALKDGRPVHGYHIAMDPAVGTDWSLMDYSNELIRRTLITQCSLFKSKLNQSMLDGAAKIEEKLPINKMDESQLKSYLNLLQRSFVKQINTEISTCRIQNANGL